MLDKPLKEEDFSPEELKKCKEDPLYFFNKYVKHKGKRDLTQEEYDSIVTARTKPEFMLRNRYGKTVFAYPKTPSECFPEYFEKTEKITIEEFEKKYPNEFKKHENTKRND